MITDALISRAGVYLLRPNYQVALDLLIMSSLLNEIKQAIGKIILLYDSGENRHAIFSRTRLIDKGTKTLN